MMPAATEKCVLYDMRGRWARHGCGHVDRIRFKIDLWGEWIVDQRNWFFAGKLCATCTLLDLRKRSIRCGKCGYAILPGDMVRRIVDEPAQCPNPAWKTRDGAYVLGCLDSPCADGGFQMCGHWTNQGFQPYESKLTIDLSRR